MRSNKWLVVVLAFVLALSMMVMPGCATTEDEPVDEPAVETPDEPAEVTFDAQAAMIDAANEYLLNSPTPNIAAADLYNVVQSQDPTYQIVSVRAPEDYAKGHIEGAINIPFKQIYTEENLAKLDPNKTIVVVCYTGHTASETTMFYRMLGYNAMSLKFGISGWTTDEEVYALGAIPSGKAAGFDTTADVPADPGPFDLPSVPSDYEDVRAAIIGQAETYFASGTPFTISAEDVNNNVVVAQDPTYQIVSVRGADDYAVGHVPGAINIPWTQIANEDNLAKLDPNKTLIVYCYTGHTGGQAAMFLNLMGYKAINMKFGITSWNADPAVGGFVGYDPAKVPNYATVAGE